MKLISWNVNGLRACVKKGFEDFFKETDADIFCVQETKLQEGQIDFAPEGYECYWNYAEKKGYSGTAVFTKKHPLKVWNGIGMEEHDQEGRVITLEFEDFFSHGELSLAGESYYLNCYNGLKGKDYGKDINNSRYAKRLRGWFSWDKRSTGDCSSGEREN